ncbi:MAG TPA: hypothetical protein VL651_03585 [Bacteroidia bacterium]|jgi:hypothetical protein|nr:hypothetical protein [Bacteroidia bacterium]
MTIQETNQRFTIIATISAIIFSCSFVSSAKADTIDFCKVFIKDSLICSTNQNDFGKGALYLEIPNETDTLEIKYFSDTKGFSGHDFVVRDYQGKLLTSFTSDKKFPFTYVPFLLPVSILPLNGSTIFLKENGKEEPVLNIVILSRQ